MKSRMNKLMSLCLVAMMGTTLIPQPIQAEEVGEFEEEKQNVEASQENSVTADFEYDGLKYKITDENKKEVEVLGFADNYHPTGNRLNIFQWAETDVHSDTTYTVTSIGDNAFKDCQFTTIKSITLPDSLTTIGESAFAGFTSIMDINSSSLDHLTTIGKSAFEGCTSLESISLPATLKNISESMFAGCTSLWDVRFDYGHYEGPSTIQLETIGESAFAGCISLGSINFNEIKNLTTIGDSAFEGCTSLGWISLPATLKTINKSTFAGCSSLSHINFDYDRYEGPSTIQLETIGESSFAGCISLGSINFNEIENLKTIGDSAFSGCTSIYRIELPGGLEQIGAHAFDLTDDNGKNDEPRLECINIPSTVTTLGESFLGGVYPDGHTALVFQGESLPANMDQKALNGISGNNNQPTVYFPKAGINAYAAESSPFVKAGLINPDRFDSSIEQKYETVQICPGKTWSYPLKHLFSQSITQKIISDDTNIASIDQDGTSITGKSIGETFVNLMIQIDGVELASDAVNKVKIKVEHNYVWQIEKWPTKDQPGSMFQYCLGCQDKKASVPIPTTGGGSTGGSTSGGSGGSSSGNTGGSGGSTSKPTNPNAPTQQVENAVYRAYNPYNGEHLYTTNYQEFKVITKNGWDDEGIAFMSESKEKGHAVYRVYNPNSGLHHYTTNVNEKNALVSLGWNDEGVAFYTSKNPKDTPVYRVYNENDGNHHYTMNANEALALISMGWKNEGIAFLTAPMK